MEYLIKPWAHQLEGIRRAAMVDHYGLLYEAGTGKTGTLINILRQKFNDKKRVLRTLIFCPPIVIKNWKDEWHKHSKIEQDKVVLLTGPGKDRLKKFKEYGYKDGKPCGRIFVTNYEALLMSDLFDAFMAWAPEALVADESHKLKDGQAKRTKLACKLALPTIHPKTKEILRPAPLHKYILSGSPVLNSPMDLFSQFLFLDGGRTFGTNFFAFRATYFHDKNAGMPKARYFPDWQIMPGALERMNQQIQAITMTAKKSECLDLPPFTQKTISVGMTPAQGRMYQQMKDEFITFIEQQGKDPSPIAATLAITKALRLMQITSGFVKTVEGEEISLKDTPKLEALKELLEQYTPHSKVLIWAVWKENYAQIRKLCDSLGLEYVEVTGETPEKQRYTRVDHFNNDPKCRVFIGHPGSGGIGINLVSSDISIFYSRTFSLEHSIQAEARNYRGGSEQHKSVTRIDLVCEGTIDDLVTAKLAQKIEVSGKILGDFKDELKKQKP